MVADVAREACRLCKTAQRPAGGWATVTPMNSTAAPHAYPNIAPCLVLPFEKPCERSGHRYAALVFAQRGGVVLFAAEQWREFGVGILDDEGRMAISDHFPTLDQAARRFLSRALPGA